MKNIPSKILIVDDNKNNLETLFAILDERGYKVITSKSGENTVKMLEKVLPDLILLDILMPPGMDGIETCKIIKQNLTAKDIPIIFMSALSETIDKVRGFEAGAVDYITKPFQIEEVLARINTHLTIQNLKSDLKESLDKEKELNRLKSQFMSMILHDLRNPLAVIQSSSDLVKYYSDRLSTEKKMKHYESIEQSVIQMTKMMDGFLMMVKAESGHFDYNPETVDVEKITAEIVTEFQEITRDTHELKYTIQKDTNLFKVDPKLIKSIFGNLLSNAIKYSPNGGEIEVLLAINKDSLVFQVKDKGLGIPAEAIPNLFNPYYRASNATNIKGTGLGLYIVKQFVELHNGTIQVESELNKGTTITVSIIIT